MSLDRQIDPKTMDYVSDTNANGSNNGKFVEVDVLENQILIAFMVGLKDWEGDSELGNRFGELARATDTIENRQRLKDLAKDALSFLVEDGSLESVDVAVEHFDAGRVAFAVDAYRPGQTTPVVLPTFLVPVGAG